MHCIYYLDFYSIKFFIGNSYGSIGLFCQEKFCNYLSACEPSEIESSASASLKSSDMDCYYREWMSFLFSHRLEQGTGKDFHVSRLFLPLNGNYTLHGQGNIYC